MSRTDDRHGCAKRTSANEPDKSRSAGGTTMSITLHLNAETERRLREEAVKNSLTLEEYLEQLAEQAVASGSAVSRETWETAWRAWAASHKPSPRAADDDRDAIYAGRGE